MNLQDLSYFLAVAEHRHFGRAAAACNVGQPSLSGQLRKLEEELGVTLFERNNRRVAITPVGARLLEHARRVLEETRELVAAAAESADPLSGPLRLGVIPTVAPYLLPEVLEELARTCPRMRVEVWEDLTEKLLDRLAENRLDAALLATPVDRAGLTALDLFAEPFLAALPPGHRLATVVRLKAADLGEDLLVLAEGHCLGDQAIMACSGPGNLARPADLRASSLETLVNLVAAGYGTTLVPSLAASRAEQRGVVIRAIEGAPSRMIRLASRPTFPRPRALQAVAAAVTNRRPNP